MESAKFLYDYDAIRKEIEDIEKRSVLKQQYMIKYRSLKEREIKQK